MKLLAMTSSKEVPLLKGAPDNSGFLKALEILKKLQIPERELSRDDE